MGNALARVKPSKPSKPSKPLSGSQLIKWLEAHIDELDVERKGGKTAFVLWLSNPLPSLAAYVIKRASIRSCVEAAIRMGCGKKKEGKNMRGKRKAPSISPVSDT